MATISTDEAEDVLFGEGLIANQEVSKHRWHTRRLVVFERDGDLMGFYHLEPATEEQEGQDEFEAVPVPVFPVVSERVTTTVYRPGGDA